MKLTIAPLAWFLITVYGAVGALILWGATGDPWWLGIALWLLLISGPANDGRGEA